VTDEMLSPLEQVIGFLSVFVKMAATRETKLPRGYHCIEDFVLQHGVSMGSFTRLPEDIGSGKPKSCFMNAYRLVQHDLIYCEGYAFKRGLVPIYHGWCVDDSGNVIDNTWEYGDVYFGVAVKQDFLYDAIQKQHTYGLLDQPHRWPLMVAEVESWRHPIMDVLKPVTS